MPESFPALRRPGDPFKDTSGPSLNILLKLMSMVSIVFVTVCEALNNLIVQAIF